MTALRLPSSIYEFYANLYAEVKESIDRKQNIVMSPFSLHIALTLTLMGASGETAKQMSNGLCLGIVGHDEISIQYETLLLLL